MRRTGASMSWVIAAVGAAALVIGVSAHVPTSGQGPRLQDPAPQEPADPGAGRGGRQGGGATSPAPRPYPQVITSAAKTDDGVFKVHRVNDTLYFEIPKKE